ncbi:MAG: hypothetical protein V2A54_09940 [Bacteroidota bacterium]
MKKTSIILTVLVALMAIVACEKQQQYQQQSPENNAPQVRAEQNTQSINEFWSAFRKAVLANNKKVIAEMTQFPFVAAYSPEGAPAFSHDINEFPIIFDILLNLKGKLHNLPSSSYELIRQSETVPKINKKEKNQFTAGVFIFRKKNGNWRLTGAQVHEYPEIVATGPNGTPQQSIQDFWNQFRQAVLTNDKNAIVSMTSFPFFTQGPTDDYPIVSHNNKVEFAKTIDTLLNSNIASAYKSESMHTFIVRNKNIAEIIATADDGSRNFQDMCYVINKFTFWKMCGKWYFSEAQQIINTENKG